MLCDGILRGLNAEGNEGDGRPCSIRGRSSGDGRDRDERANGQRLQRCDDIKRLGIEADPHSAFSRGRGVVVTACRIGLPPCAGLLRRRRMAVRVRRRPRGLSLRVTIHQAAVERARQRGHSHHDNDQASADDTHQHDHDSGSPVECSRIW